MKFKTVFSIFKRMLATIARTAQKSELKGPGLNIEPQNR